MKYTIKNLRSDFPNDESMSGDVVKEFIKTISKEQKSKEANNENDIGF